MAKAFVSTRSPRPPITLSSLSFPPLPTPDSNNNKNSNKNKKSIIMNNRRSASAPRSNGSYSINNNGWESQDMPSYMTPSTPPPSNEGNDLATKIKLMKRRRPTIIKRPSADSAIYKLYAKFVHGGISNYVALVTAIILWYLLGVVSIGTTKVLLNKGVPPLFLTIQQLFLGSSLLRLLLNFRALGSVGLAPWPKPSASSPVRRTQKQQDPDSFWSWHLRDLVLAGVYFALGFAATNLSFSGASPSFVETVKAAEPITSAATAVAWGIEVLSCEEVASLLTIVAGVLLSTLGNSSGGGTTAVPLSVSLRSSMTVMVANLCFSFRGLHQKLFRASPNGGKGAFDDLNLQFRMQIVGMGLLIVPVLIWDSRTLFSLLWNQPYDMTTTLEFVALALLNGCAFASYNLASTFVLTRISVVHHAALNCIRRIFAIIVTSFAFSVPITLVGAMGICVSFGGFMAFTRYKIKRQSRPKPISTLLPISAA